MNFFNHFRFLTEKWRNYLPFFLATICFLPISIWSQRVFLGAVAIYSLNKILLIVVAKFLALGLLLWMLKLALNIKKHDKVSVCLFFTILVSGLFWHITQYPGNFSTDTGTILTQTKNLAINNDWSYLTPTFYLSALQYFPSISSIVLCQIVLIALLWADIFSYLRFCLPNTRVRSGLMISFGLLFIFLPSIFENLVFLTRDTLFSHLLIYSSVLIWHSRICKVDKSLSVKLCLASAIVGTLRPESIYVIAVVLFIIIFSSSFKELRRFSFLMMLCTIILVRLILPNTLVKDADQTIFIHKVISLAPILGEIFRQGTFTEEEKRKISYFTDADDLAKHTSPVSVQAFFDGKIGNWIWSQNPRTINYNSDEVRQYLKTSQTLIINNIPVVLGARARYFGEYLIASGLMEKSIFNNYKWVAEQDSLNLIAKKHMESVFFNRTIHWANWYVNLFSTGILNFLTWSIAIPLLAIFASLFASQYAPNTALFSLIVNLRLIPIMLAGPQPYFRYVEPTYLCLFVLAVLFFIEVRYVKKNRASIPKST